MFNLILHRKYFEFLIKTTALFLAPNYAVLIYNNQTSNQQNEYFDFKLYYKLLKIMRHAINSLSIKNTAHNFITIRSTVMKNCLGRHARRIWEVRTITSVNVGSDHYLILLKIWAKIIIRGKYYVAIVGKKFKLASLKNETIIDLCQWRLG